MNTMVLNIKIKTIEDNMPQAKIKKILEILDNKNFGTQQTPKVIKIISKIKEDSENGS